MSQQPASEPTVEEEEVVEVQKPIVEPEKDTIEWIHYWSLHQGFLPSPINITITGSIFYKCPPMTWFNFDIYPHKVKLTNTGKTLMITAKWITERPYITNGPFLPNKKYIFSHLHFHWGANMMEGSEHTIDGAYHPMEAHMVYFNSLYLTQEEAFQHNDGIVIVCYLIRFGVVPDKRFDIFLNAFPKIQEAGKSTRVGPVPLSHTLNMFVNDYFLYWGSVGSASSEKVALWMVPRIPMSASEDQIKMFRGLLNPWDEPNTRNFRKVQETEDRHVFFVNPEWSLHASLLPTPRAVTLSISVPSPAYVDYPETIPLLNTEIRQKYSVPVENVETE